MSSFNQAPPGLLVHPWVPGGLSRPHPPLSREPLVVDSCATRHSKAFYKTHLRHLSELKIKVTSEVKIRSNIKMWRFKRFGSWGSNDDPILNTFAMARDVTSKRKQPLPAPRPGGRLNAPPSGFLRIAKIQRRAAPPDFHPPYPPSFPQLLWKFRPKAMWGQVTRSGQVTQLQNNFPIAPRLQCFRENYETFGIWWGHQCLQNVYLGFLISVTSGQVIFATSPLCQFAKNQLRYIYFGASLFEWNDIV